MVFVRNYLGIAFMLQDGRVSAVTYLADGLLIMSTWSWPVWFSLLTVFCGDKEGGSGIWVRLQGGDHWGVGAAWPRCAGPNMLHCMLECFCGCAWANMTWTFGTCMWPARKDLTELGKQCRAELQSCPATAAFGAAACSSSVMHREAPDQSRNWGAFHNSLHLKAKFSWLGNTAWTWVKMATAQLGSC